MKQPFLWAAVARLSQVDRLARLATVTCMFPRSWRMGGRFAGGFASRMTNRFAGRFASSLVGRFAAPPAGQFACRGVGPFNAPFNAPFKARFKALIAVTLTAFASTAFAFGPTVSLLPRIADARLDSALAHTALGIIRNNIDPYPDGLVHRPHSEEPGDAVSEGQAYGMIVALYSDDQATFNRIWDAAEKAMWSDEAKLYNWRLGAEGGIIGTGMATDADQDIALMLLFADSLAKAGKWRQHQSPKGVGYLARAKEIISSIWGQAVEEGKYLAPGANWGGKAFVNPGYFSPASYRIFAKVDKDHNWNGVIDQCYRSLFANPGAGKGLLPDWMTPDGQFYGGSLGYNAYRTGQSMYKDAIRVHWRLAMDWLWFGEARAKLWLDSAAAFIAKPERANFYTMDGLLLPVTDTFTLGTGEMRSRREYSELTVGMWACAPFASLGPDSSKAWANALLDFAPTGIGLWGKDADASLPGRDGSTPNEGYFEQFLAWFGAATLAGRFSNIWEDLDDPQPQLPLATTKPFRISTASSQAMEPPPVDLTLDLQKGPLQLAAGFNKPAHWTVQITSTHGASWSQSGRDANLVLTWNGMDGSGKPFPTGWCLAHLSVRGLADKAEHWQRFWLGHHRDLRIDNTWLLLDDFSGTELKPNIGSWGSFDNARLSGTAKVTSMAPEGTGNARALSWSFDLGQGGYQFCGVEWQAGDGSVFRGAQSVRFRAKADKRMVVDFHLVQSDIGDDNYFGVLDTLTTQWKTFEHRFADMRGRLGQRDGNADPQKGNALRWHIQFDKNAGIAPTLTSGIISMDDFQIGGDLTQMYVAPGPVLSPDQNPPTLDVKDDARRNGGLLKGRHGRSGRRGSPSFFNGRFWGLQGFPSGASASGLPGQMVDNAQGTFPRPFPTLLVEHNGRAWNALGLSAGQIPALPPSLPVP